MILGIYFGSFGPKRGSINEFPKIIQQIKRKQANLCSNRLSLFENNPTVLRIMLNITMAKVNIINKHLDGSRFYITMGDILLWPILLWPNKNALQRYGICWDQAICITMYDILLYPILLWPIENTLNW